MMIPAASSDCFDLGLPTGAFLKAPPVLDLHSYEQHVLDVAEYNRVWDLTDGFKTRELATIKPGVYSLDEFLSA